MSQKLILASTSPYRRELLNRLGLTFDVANPQTDETPLPGETPEPLSLRLSEAKARAVASLYPDALIIGSDQVATVDGKIYGKPGNHQNAVEQLRELSGKTVNFFTGLCLLNAQNGRADVRGIPTLVTFRQLTDSEIENYLRREPAYNCAGSAKSEGLGIALLSSMRGEDPNALVGLPLIALCDMLRRQGVAVI
jgi:septum formation protein